MDPVTLSLLASAGSSLIKGISGAAQKAKGNRMSRMARPQDEIPSAVNEYLNNAKAAAARSTLPGQDIIDQKIGGATAAGIRNATEGASSSAGLMAGIAGIRGNEQSAIADTGIAGAQMQDANKDKLQAALLKYGQYQDQQFQTNKLQPYYENAAAAQALKGAGNQNIMNGIEGVLGAASIAGQNSKGINDTGINYVPKDQMGKLGFADTLNANNGASNGLGAQTNAQKYLNAKRKGFTGSYTDWTSQQTLGGGLNFNIQ